MSKTDDFQDSDWFFSMDHESRRKYLEAHWEGDRQDRRAKAVLDLLLALSEEPLDLDSPPEVLETRAAVRHKSLADCVRENLDADSIWSFVFLAYGFVDSNRAKLNAGKRHAENRAMKAEVFEWLDSNFAKQSMDAAASEIAGKVVPVAWRTARDWVADWKKVRSAGTA